jgi:hypothetical protein
VLFTLPFQRDGFSTSYLAQHKLFETFNLRVPDRQEIKEMDQGKYVISSFNLEYSLSDSNKLANIIF